MRNVEAGTGKAVCGLCFPHVSVDAGLHFGGIVPLNLTPVLDFLSFTLIVTSLSLVLIKYF